jgi:uncharacterized membrane protein
MTKKEFSMSEAITYGWNTMKANFWFFLGVLIIAGLIAGIPSAIASALQKESHGLSFLFRIIAWIADIIISIGLITIALKFLDNTKAELNDLFSFKPYFWQYLLGSILYGLIVLGGFILLIVPGIIWAIKFQYYGYFIIDKKLDAIEALKKSSALTMTVRWELLGFGVVMFCINIVGAICLLVGLFVTIPTTLLAYTLVFRKLLTQLEAAPAPAEEAKPKT